MAVGSGGVDAAALETVGCEAVGARRSPLEVFTKAIYLMLRAIL
jgi:hypothetical protein